MKYFLFKNQYNENKALIKIKKIEIQKDKLIKFENDDYGYLVRLYLEPSHKYIYANIDKKDNEGNYLVKKWNYKKQQDDYVKAEFPKIMNIWVPTDLIKDDEVDVSLIQEFLSDESAHLWAIATIL